MIKEGIITAITAVTVFIGGYNTTGEYTEPEQVINVTLSSDEA